MNSTVELYWFCVGRSELDVSITVHWWNYYWEKKQTKNTPIIQELQANCFFLSLSNWRRSCRKIILTAGSQSGSKLFILKRSNLTLFWKQVFLKKSVQSSSRFYRKRKCCYSTTFYFLTYVYDNLDAVRDTSFPII